MIELLAAAALALAQDAVHLRCDSIHDRSAHLARGTVELVRDDDEDRITRVPLTAPAPGVRVYNFQPVSISLRERFSHDTEGFTDTYEVLLPAPLIAVRGMVRIAHNFDCVPSLSDNDRCVFPDLGTRLAPVMLSAERRGSQTLLTCTRVRPRG